jgi:hypothetical protein
MARSYGRESIGACHRRVRRETVILTGPAQGRPLTIQTISATQPLNSMNAAIAKRSQPRPKITIRVAFGIRPGIRG